MVGRTLIDLDIRANYGCNVVAIKEGPSINVSPNATDLIKVGDILIVIGSDEDISRFERDLIIDK